MLHNVDARKIADHRNNIRGCYEKELICKLRGNSEAAEIWDAAPSESRTLFGDDNYKWYHRNHDSVYERWR